jgi:acyl-CoA reductase-like NAD-dependent aldehyde dehydrogenase
MLDVGLTLHREWLILLTTITVPPGVLSVLPGYGYKTGKEIVAHPLIRKVDITVRCPNSLPP